MPVVSVSVGWNSRLAKHQPLACSGPGDRVENVEHIAAARAPYRAVALAPAIKHHLGIGNSTGLGMAPFLVSHPRLLNNWVHARETARAIKMEGRPNPLRERLQADPAFAAVAGRLEELLDPARYVGRAPRQVLEFVQAEVDPLLERHRDLIGADAEVRV